MNNDKKNSSNIDKEGLFIPSRQLSFAMTGAVMVLFCVFMGGYFVGKNHMIEPLMVRIEHGSFADQVYTSLYARYEQEESATTAGETTPTAAIVAIEESTKEMPLLSAAASAPTAKKGWYAPLVGYPEERLAAAFAQKLQKKGIAVEVKKHTSASAQGTKKKSWYQVVTTAWDNREALSALVDKVAREEKLKDVTIKEIKL